MLNMIILKKFYQLLIILACNMSLALPAVAALSALDKGWLDLAAAEFKASNYQAAADTWEKMADKGIATAQYSIALCYKNSIGRERDISSTERYLQLAAEQGHAISMHLLGVIYLGNDGIPSAPEKAIKWWSKAAKLGNAPAQRLLGLASYVGLGAEQDITKSVYWLEQYQASTPKSETSKLLTMIKLKHAATSEQMLNPTPFPDQAVNPDQNIESSTGESQPDHTVPTTASQPTQVTRAEAPPQPPPMTPSQDDQAPTTASANVNDNVVEALNMPIYATRHSGLKPFNMAPVTSVEVLENHGDWLLVKSLDRFTVWVYGKYIDDSMEPAVVNVNNLVIRPQPSSDSNSPPLGQFDRGTEVDVIDHQGEWIKIYAPESLTAWTPTTELSGRLLNQMNSDSTTDTEQDTDNNTLPEPTTEPGKHVAIQGADVYAYLGVNATPFTRIAANTQVEIVSMQENWLRIRYPDRLKVWVYGSFLSATETEEATIIGSNVRIRTLPSTASNSLSLGQFTQGDSVTIIDRKGVWRQVLAPQYVTAWVRADDITTSE